MNKRTSVSIILLVLVGVTPFWVYIPALMLSVIFIPLYFEAILFAFLIDVLYGSQTHIGLSLAFPFATLVCLFLIMSIPLRERLRLGY